MELKEWVVEAEISSMQEAMEKGDFTSEQLTRAYLERIEAYDAGLRSILEVNPDALLIARELDKERQSTGSRGPLHGIPVLLKDNLDTADRMHTSAGSLALADSSAAADSFVAARLRAAGAVLLGKTNMTEWANFMSGSMWAGYSARGGQTLNPYGAGEVFIGGSSSGSGAAAAANFAAAAIGTETCGSIISPASQNNLVGIKPTVGLVSRSGIIPITNSQDTAGPLARTVADAALLLSVIAGVDEADKETAAAAPHIGQDYTRFLDASSLKQARIGIPRYYYRQLDPARLAVAEQAIQVMREQGAVIVDPVSLSCEGTAFNGDVLRYEFKKYLNEYLNKLPPHLPVHSLEEVIAYNNKHAEAELKYGQGTLIWSEETSGTLTELEYLAALANNAKAREALDKVLDQHQLDAIMLLGCEDGVDLAAMAGYPSLTVPGGFASEGVTAAGGYNTKGPQGITLIGRAFSEPVLIKIAYGFEQCTRHRTPPVLRQSAE
ncbi:amidase family protein [Paenibacillus pinistramenti]|uniref:amidase family protein n=1 Tax=Paenibacillus pinistramenti TaxID=1768003 RepID=UPI001109A49A|nr:amidase family protein [Paenibacillus pinistramenti]